MSWYTRVGALVGGGVMLFAAPLVMKYEGKEPTAYLDPIGIPTICFGHTRTVSRDDVRNGVTLSDEECTELLNGDLAWAVEAVEDAAEVSMPVTMRAAFVSFTYNVGETQWRKSTLLRVLNEGQYAEACAQLSRWVYADGKKLRGLERRRAAERKLCEHDLDEVTDA